MMDLKTRRRRHFKYLKFEIEDIWTGFVVAIVTFRVEEKTITRWQIAMFENGHLNG